MNLHQKINQIMSEVTYIYKDGQISFGTTKYRAVTEEQVLSIIRPHLIKHHIVIYPIDLKIEREQQITPDGKVLPQITTANMVFKVVDADNPEDFFLVASAGQGSDTQDKGAGKSITYAEKYALLKMFLVPTGDDPDKVSSAELDARQELENPIVTPEIVRAQIMVLGGSDLDRINSFIHRFLSTEKDLDDLTLDELVKVKTGLAQRVRK